MPSRRRHALPGPLRAALAVLVLGLAGLMLLDPAPLALLRERIFDAVVIRLPRPAPPVPIVVVDIGEVDEAGLPWDRSATARLARHLSQSGARAIGYDIVFSGDCGRSPVNDALASGFGGDSVLGFLLADRAGLPPRPQPPFAIATPPPQDWAAMWTAPGGEGACPVFAAQAGGQAAVALAGDADGVVRRLAVAVLVGDAAYPALAVELARRAIDQPISLLAAAGLRLGPRLLPVDGQGQIRLLPSRPEDWAQRSLAAADVLAGRVDAARLDGAVVLVGSSLPRRGGLRATAASPLQPSVQIQADALRAILAGPLPYRPAFATGAEAGVVVLAGLAVIGLWRTRAGRRMWLPVAVPAIGAVLWPLAALLLAGVTGWLIDPLLPAVAVLALLALAVAARAIAATRAERALQARLGQLLPPAVVARLAEAPELFRLEGEAREVTVLFTDIEGFTALTRSLGPQALVHLLDRYFDMTTAIVLRHGGMIDKIVGDGMHVLFNAPLDLPGHADAALACAADLLAATEGFRGQLERVEPGGANTEPARLGRTRIGIETGPVILGDVGAAGKIDYTAHGEAVNLAARLEAANKDLGTQILIGPATARAAKQPLIPVGEVEIRSFGRVSLFTLALPGGAEAPGGL